MKTLARLAILTNLLGYLALMRVDPSYGFVHPRGGMAMLATSLALAWLGIRAASQTQRPLDQRFQFGAAAWIWFLVQGFGTAYVYWHAVAG